MFVRHLRSVIGAGLLLAGTLGVTGQAAAATTQVDYGSFNQTATIAANTALSVQFNVLPGHPSNPLSFLYSTSSGSPLALATFFGTATDSSGNAVTSGSLLSANTRYFFNLSSTSFISLIAPGTAATVTFSGLFVPEPQEWLMIVAGLGLLGYAARRRSLAMSAAPLTA